MDDDPWNWTVDQVVACFCHDRTLWCDRPNSKLPDPGTFEQLLRESEIDGATLLDCFNFTTLRTELDIQSIPERAAVAHGIDKLQRRSTHFAAIHGLGPSGCSQAPLLSKSLSEPPATDIRASIIQPATPPLGTLLVSPSKAEAEPRTPNLRPGERFQQDGKRKRRKLDLNGPIAPISTAARHEPGSCSFLGRNKSPLDNVFYDDGHVQAATDDASDVEDEFSFAQVPDAVPHGRRQFVQLRLQYMFRADPLKLSNERYVIHPYPERLIKEGNSRHSTLFTCANQRVVSEKKNTLFLDSDVSTTDESLDQNGSWDFLMKWSEAPDTDTILPLYNESGSENDFDESLLDELEQEQQQASSTVRDTEHMSLDSVLGIIDESIQKSALLWNERKLPQRQRSAITLWKKGQGHKNRDTVLAVQRELSALENRLGKLKQHVAEDQWAGEVPLRKQCAALQLTVNAIQDCKWKLNLWSHPRPSRIPKELAARRMHKMPSQDHESGEEVGSETDMDQLSDIDMPDVVSAPSSAHSDDLNYRGVISPSEWSGLSPDPPIDEEVENVSEPLYHEDDSDDSVLGNIDSGESSTPLELFKRGELIDLTMSSPNKDSHHYIGAGLDESEDVYGPCPEDASEEEIEKWAWKTLDQTSDRKRIVMKLLLEIERKDREKIENFFLDRSFRKLREDLQKALSSIKRKRDGISGFDDSTTVRCLFLASRLWVCWNAGLHHYRYGDIPPTVMKSAIKMNDFPAMFNFVYNMAKSTDHGFGDETYDEEVSGRTRRKKRKKKIIKDRNAQLMRSQAQKRLEEGDERELQVLQSSPTGEPASSERSVIVNSMKSDNDEFVFLNPEIASRVKPHQERGIRFMWRELVGSGSKLGEGCLLAHTMGLGKTMQTISLLVTIAEAANSDIPNIVDQVPKALRQSRTLILCPAVLIENWKDEFATWLPHHTASVGEVFSINAQVDTIHRTSIINRWYNGGGVLLLSYDLFTRLLRRPIQDPDLRRENAEAAYGTLRKQLLQGPNIVVADEAHKFRNPASQVAKAVKQIRTRSRIALTGSPLANNLRDYYEMIEWVAPGYLGSNVEFKAYYEEPIQAGLYADSTNFEQRRSLKKLRVLKNDIAPKIDRADITALHGDIKPKTEFVIRLPLTKLQCRLYTTFVRLVRKDGASTTMKMFDWMHSLTSLCNHPSIFLNLMKSRVALRCPRRHGGDADSTESDDNPEAIALDLSHKMVSIQETILAEEYVRNVEDPSLSNKMKIISAILVEAKQSGDQTLVFSHQLPTLDYLERFIAGMKGIHCVRLDGKTKMAGRLDLIKDFNAGSCDVFLISTRAGALGLNISGANRVILVDFHFNPSHEEQAVGRAYRIGQEKPVFVYHLVTAGSFEAKLHDVTIFKRQLAFRVVDNKSPDRFSAKVNQFLFEPVHVAKMPLEEFYGKDVVMDRLLDGPLETVIQSLHTTETMLADKEENLTAEEEAEVRAMMEDDKLRKSDRHLWSSKTVPVGVQEQASQQEGEHSAQRSPVASTLSSRLFAANNGRSYQQLGQIGAVPVSQVCVTTTAPASDLVTELRKSRPAYQSLETLLPTIEGGISPMVQTQNSKAQLSQRLPMATAYGTQDSFANLTSPNTVRSPYEMHVKSDFKRPHLLDFKKLHPDRAAFKEPDDYVGGDHSGAQHVNDVIGPGRFSLEEPPAKRSQMQPQMELGEISNVIANQKPHEIIPLTGGSMADPIAIADDNENDD